VLLVEELINQYDIFFVRLLRIKKKINLKKYLLFFKEILTNKFNKLAIETLAID